MGYVEAVVHVQVVALFAAWPSSVLIFFLDRGTLTIIIHYNMQLAISELCIYGRPALDMHVALCIAIHLLMASISLSCVLNAPTATEHI